MAIRKPILSVHEARRLSSIRPEGHEISQPPEDLSKAAASDLQGHEPHRPPLQDEMQAVIELESAAPVVPLPLPANSDIKGQPEKVIAPQSLPVEVSRSTSAAKLPAKFPVFPSVERSRDAMRIQVFVSAYIPAPGVSISFDQLSRQYSPEKALQMILRRALDDYEEKLKDGTFQNMPDSYPTDGKLVVQTSRIMPQNLVDISRTYFDPLGFESTRAFGQKLASAALASFFATEKKRL